MLKVDTHQHFWNLDEVAYSWLVPEYGPIYREFAPDELEPQLAAAGLDKTVIVHSANSYADTDSMLAIAAARDDAPVGADRVRVALDQPLERAAVPPEDLPVVLADNDEADLADEPDPVGLDAEVGGGRAVP